MRARGIHQFAIHPVRLGRIPADLPPESGGRGDFFREFLNRDVGAVTDIDDFRFAAILHEVINRVCHIIDMEKFTERFSCAPEDFFRPILFFRLDKTPDQGRKNVTIDKVVGVIRAVEVAGHEADRIPSILFAEVQTEFITGDFCQSITLVRRLQRACQQILFLDRLRRLARIDAAGAQEAELFDFMQVTLHDHVVLDFEVFQQKLRAMRFVRHDPADFCAREDHIIRMFRIEEILDGLLIAEIKLRMGPLEDIGIAFLFELADACAADHAAMAADKNPGIFVNHNAKPQKPIS